MPVEAANPNRRKYTHLEALGRLLAGIAPWLAAGGLNESETKQQQKFVSWAQASLDAATDPKSADFMNFHDGSQPLVDAAFLAQGILRARQILWFGLDMRARKQLINCLRARISSPNHKICRARRIPCARNAASTRGWEPS